MIIMQNSRVFQFDNYLFQYEQTEILIEETYLQNNSIECQLPLALFTSIQDVYGEIMQHASIITLSRKKCYRVYENY